MISWKTTCMFLFLLQAGLQAAADQYSSAAGMNKMLYIDGTNGTTTLVSLDGTSKNCDLEKYPVHWPVAVTYSEKDGQVLACGGWGEADADRCWQFDGSTWSPLPNSGQKHCLIDSPNVMVGDSWWITGRLQFYVTDDYFECTRSANEIFTGQDWIPGPALHGDELNAAGACMVNLNSTHTMLIGGFKNQALQDVWLYDWTTQEWTMTSSLNRGRHNHGCVSLGDQGVLVAGGYDGPGPSYTTDLTYTVERYNPIEGTWSNQADLPQDIENTQASLLNILLNWNNQIIALFYGSDQIYKWSKENDEWNVLEGVRLPEKMYGRDYDKAILVPDDFSPSCN